MASYPLTCSIEEGSTVDSPASRRAILLLFTISGATGLMLEVVWSRMLTTLLGATTWSVLAVLVTYMGGLGLGSVLWGRIAGRTANPLRLYGWLEVAVGLYTLAVPVLLEALGVLLIAATRILGEAPQAALALRIVASVLALAPPTLLMGGTLPVLTRFVAAGRAQAGREAGVLYAANTAGAVLGCLVTGCVLILWLGVVETNALAAVLDIGVGVSALSLAARRPGLAVDRTEAKDPADPVSGPRRGGTALLVASVSGFCGLAYELLWTRGLLATVTDDTTYAFTMMLTAFLAGHALGAALAGRDRESRRATDDWRRLGTAQVLAQAPVGLGVHLGDDRDQVFGLGVQVAAGILQECKVVAHGLGAGFEQVVIHITTFGLFQHHEDVVIVLHHLCPTKE